MEQINMSEVRLHMWEKSYTRGNHMACRARNYVNAYDEKQRESYSARGQAKAETESRNTPAVEILSDPLPRCDGGFACGARFKRDEFKVMMQQGVVTENTKIFVDGGAWLIVPTSSDGGKTQRKIKTEI